MKKEKLDSTRKIILGALYIGYLFYLYVLVNKWDLASGGNLFIGLIQGVIPLSAVILINLVLKRKVNISIPI